MAKSFTKSTISDQLLKADYAFNAPFDLVLRGGDTLRAVSVVRLVPGRRMVVFGTWQGKPVAAKLFLDARRARQHLQKEVSGFNILNDNKIPTPPLYQADVSEDGRIYVAIFERIIDASNAEAWWLERQSLHKIMPILSTIMIELATQHVLGIKQCDLHMKNFLAKPDPYEPTFHIYTLDGAQLSLQADKLDKKDSMQNVALFLAQFGVGVENYQLELFRHYANARGWYVKRKDILDLLAMIEAHSNERWRRFEKKIWRDCTDFTSVQRLTMTGMHDRSYVGREWSLFLRDPEYVFTHASAVILKAGRSSTVVKVVLDGRELVVKRYNMKSGWHFVRRCLRTTRAKKSWRIAQKLRLFHIATAKPVAYLEKRYAMLKGVSYFVTEYVPTSELKDFAPYTEVVSKLLKNLLKLSVTHGDLKLSNILMDKQGQPLLIDFDGAKEHRSPYRLKEAWQREISRFLRNFNGQPALQHAFKDSLQP